MTFGRLTNVVWGGVLVGLLMLAGTAGCGAGWPSPRVGDEIIVAGQLFHTGTRVVTYLEPGGYNAYRCYNHFDPTRIMPRNPSDKDNPNRYGPTRRNLPDELQAAVDKQGWTLGNLRKQVDQFVIHYDMCGTSQECFYLLQDIRGLSAHFMLDLDGTIYQTLDLTERAWHAAVANDRSVGIEIANMGAYVTADKLSEWYSLDQLGRPFVSYPKSITHQELLKPNFVARPARKQPVEGTVNGVLRYQYDYTNEQYAALIKLTATLHRVLPRIALVVPRGPDGKVEPNTLSEERLKAFHGVLAHWHVSLQKQDPGPAFDWDRVLRGAAFAM